MRTLCERFYDDLSHDLNFKYRKLENQAKEPMVKFHTLKSLDMFQINGCCVFFVCPSPAEYYSVLVLDSLLHKNLMHRENEGYRHKTEKRRLNPRGCCE